MITSLQGLMKPDFIEVKSPVSKSHRFMFLWTPDVQISRKLKRLHLLQKHLKCRCWLRIPLESPKFSLLPFIGFLMLVVKLPYFPLCHSREHSQSKMCRLKTTKKEMYNQIEILDLEDLKRHSLIIEILWSNQYCFHSKAHYLSRHLHSFIILLHSRWPHDCHSR